MGLLYLQIKEISKLEKDRADLAKLLDTERKRISNNAKLATEAQARIQTLSTASTSVAAALKDVETKLDAARQQVVALEKAVSMKAEEMKKHQAEIKASQAKLLDISAESERAKESISLGEKNLSLVAGQLSSQKRLLNPLNHPKVQGLLGRK